MTGPNENAVNSHHYAIGAIMNKIERGLDKAGQDRDTLKVDDLAPIDEFHSRGRAATLELASFANLTPSTRVLDVGCGFGGTATLRITTDVT